MLSIIADEQVIAVFKKHEAVIKIGNVALRYAADGMMFMPPSVPVNMLYQGIQKPAISSVPSMIRSVAITILMLLICVQLFCLTGIQIAQPTADIMTGFTSIPFIIHS